MHSETRPREAWKYERGPVPGVERAGGLHLGLLLAFTFSLSVWGAIGIVIWIYLG